MRPIRRLQWKPWVSLERWWPILCNHWLWSSNIRPRLELQLKQAGLRTEKIYWIYWMFCPFVSSNMTSKNENRLGFLVKTARKISGCCRDRLLAIYNKHVLNLTLCSLAVILACLWGGPKESKVFLIPTAAHLLNGK